MAGLDYLMAGPGAVQKRSGWLKLMPGPFGHLVADQGAVPKRSGWLKMLAGPFGLLVAGQGAVPKRSWVAEIDGRPNWAAGGCKMGFPLPPNWAWG